MPSEILDSLVSQSRNFEDVVRQLEDKFNLDRTTLRDPDPDSKVIIRCLARTAKSTDRLDVVKELRKIVPAGTTGELT